MSSGRRYPAIIGAFFLLVATAPAQVVVKVTAIPALKPDGRPWDAGIGNHRLPDVFLRVDDADGQKLSVENLVMTNADPTQINAQNPLVFPLKSAAPKYPLRIEVLDRDEITNSDFMGLVTATGTGTFVDASGKTQLVVVDVPPAYPDDLLAAYVAAMEKAKILPERPPLHTDLDIILTYGAKKVGEKAQDSFLELVLGEMGGSIAGSVLGMREKFTHTLTEAFVAGHCTTAELIAIEQFLQRSFTARYEVIDKAFGYKRPQWSILDEYSSRHDLPGAPPLFVKDPVQIAKERAIALDYRRQMESERIYQEYALEELHKFRDRFVAPEESRRKR